MSTATSTEEETIEIPHLPGDNIIVGNYRSFLHISDSFRDYRLDNMGIATLDSQIRKRDIMAADTLEQTVRSLGVDLDTAWMTQSQFLHLMPQHLLGEGRPNLCLIKKDERRSALHPGNAFVVVVYSYTIGKAAFVYELAYQGAWINDKSIPVRIFLRQQESP